MLMKLLKIQSDSFWKIFISHYFETITATLSLKTLYISIYKTSATSTYAVHLVKLIYYTCYHPAITSYYSAITRKSENKKILKYMFIFKISINRCDNFWNLFLKFICEIQFCTAWRFLKSTLNVILNIKENLLLLALIFNSCLLNDCQFFHWIFMLKQVEYELFRNVNISRNMSGRQ